MGYEIIPSHNAHAKPQKRKNYGRAVRICVASVLCGLVLGRFLGCEFLSTTADPEAGWEKLPIGSYKWWKCDDYAEGVDCGFIIVPTDHLNYSVGATKIALGRYKATKGPKQGIVLTNPGGPGVPGTLLTGRFMQAYVGEDYDVIGFDPRGIGRTEPRVNCFGGHDKLVSFTRNTVLDRSFDLGPNLTDPNLREHLLRQQREANALYKAQFELCGKAMGEQLKYMGTTTVVRDMNFMTTVLDGPDALINYYGGSYGSILGQYLVNMFPDRMGRASIDAIADAVAWSSKPPHKWYRQWLGYTEAAYDIFVRECFDAGPSSCDLAKPSDKDQHAIRDRLERFFDNLYLSPLPVPNGPRPGILTAGMARKYFFVTLELPKRWKQAASVLATVIDGGDASPLLPDIFDFYQDLERSGVSCNDQPSKEMYHDPPSDEEIVDEMLDIAKHTTKFAWGVLTTEADSGCQHWYPNVGEPPERFTGPWNHTLKNPMLIVSNTDDPITPVTSARMVSKFLGTSARLALNNAPGHGTSSMGSLCIIKLTRAYFANGTLPDEEHLCQPDRKPFGVDILAQDYSLEEVQMLEAMDTVNRLYERRIRW